MISKFPKPLSERFGIIHHKALNTRENLDAALKIATKYDDQLHIFEGDICWYFDKGTDKFGYYFFHPHYGFDRLTGEQVAKRNKTGGVLTLQDIIDVVPDNILLIIELKVGTGNMSTCFDQLLPKLQNDLAGRFWVDTFSKKQLAMVRAKDASIPITMHTERIVGNKLWTLVPEWPSFYTTELSELDWLDGFSIRHWKNYASIAKAAKHVTKKNKALFISRIFTASKLKQSLKLGANAGYFETQDIEKLMPIIQAHEPASENN